MNWNGSAFTPVQGSVEVTIYGAVTVSSAMEWVPAEQRWVFAWLEQEAGEYRIEVTATGPGADVSKDVRKLTLVAVK